MVQSLSLPCRIKRINKMTNKEKDKSKVRQFFAYSILPFSCSKLIYIKEKQKQISTKPIQQKCVKMRPNLPPLFDFLGEKFSPKKYEPTTRKCCMPPRDVLLHTPQTNKKTFQKKSKTTFIPKNHQFFPKVYLVYSQLAPKKKHQGKRPTNCTSIHA